MFEMLIKIFFKKIMLARLALNGAKNTPISLTHDNQTA